MTRIGKGRWLLLSLVLSLLLFPVFHGAALELDAIFDFGNLGFSPNRDSSDTGFTGLDWLWGGTLELAHQFSDNVEVRGGIYRDVVLRNVAYAMMYYKLDYFRMGFGIIQGVQNSADTVLKPGIASSVRVDVPGVVFASFLFDYSLGGPPIEVADYLQSRSEFVLGFYAHNVICSLGVYSKKFVEQETAQEVVDDLIRYFFKADVFRKNSPYRLVFTFGYQSMQKKFLDGSASPPVHTLNSLLAGAELDVDVTRYLALLVGLDASVFTLGDDQLAGLQYPGPGGFLFTAHAGFSLNFAALKARR